MNGTADSERIAGGPDTGGGAAGPYRTEGTDLVEGALALLGGTSTAPRRAIVEALVAVGRLRTAEALLHEAREHAPGVSLATVYRTLDRLDVAGAIKRATLASGEVGYAYCEPGHHEHAICLRCGALQVVRPCVVDEAPPLEGFRIVSHTLDFTGICARCQAEGDGDTADAGRADDTDAEAAGAGRAADR